MLGDVKSQRIAKINTAFVKKLISAMRRRGAKRFVASRRPEHTLQGHLSPILWMIRHTLARGFDGQRKDNESVMEYLSEEVDDIEWMVHRAGIGSDGP